MKIDRRIKALSYFLGGICVYGASFVWRVLAEAAVEIPGGSQSEAVHGSSYLFGLWLVAIAVAFLLCSAWSAYGTSAKRLWALIPSVTAIAIVVYEYISFRELPR